MRRTLIVCGCIFRALVRPRKMMVSIYFQMFCVWRGALLLLGINGLWTAGKINHLILFNTWPEKISNAESIFFNHLNTGAFPIKLYEYTQALLASENRQPHYFSLFRQRCRRRHYDGYLYRWFWSGYRDCH